MNSSVSSNSIRFLLRIRKIYHIVKTWKIRRNGIFLFKMFFGLFWYDFRFSNYWRVKKGR